MRKYTDINPNDPPDRPTWVDGVDNPYLHGPYTPVVTEVMAVDLEVTGVVPFKDINTLGGGTSRLGLSFALW